MENPQVDQPQAEAKVEAMSVDVVAVEIEEAATEMPKEEVIERSTPNDDDIPQTLVMETATDETIIPQTTDVPKTEIEVKPIEATLVQKSNALSLLVQYSDSESEEDASIYRKPQSESSSSSSSSDSEDIIDIKVIEKKIRDLESGDDSGGENPNRKKKQEPLKVKGEMSINDLPPIQDLQITVDERECIEIGVITTIVDQLVLVEALRNSVPLDIDSVMFLDNGKKVLGQVFDVIGPVVGPIYCIRFNNHDDIISKGISVGNKVFCAPRTEHSSFVILSQVMTKGSDASWKNDIEPPENLLEHSDDEYERSKKRQAKSNRLQQNQPNERREFARGRRHLPNQNQQQHQPNLAYPNYSWHQNIPQNYMGPQNYPRQ